MDEFKSEMDELKSAILASHQQIEKEFNGKMKKMIEDQQQQRTTMPFVPIPNNEKMGNLDQQVAPFIWAYVLNILKFLGQKT
jgi:polyhydroxyalkanoate synthesis regulator phasin